jgi:tRNA1Val (adenine37-N6)-methyltransferase
MARNSSFQFKQFRVQQDRCAMKVCTDACVLGAWADLPPSGRILDIGAGTGLLSLMTAQRTANAHIDAVEVDPQAAAQAVENVWASPYDARIQVHCKAVQNFRPRYSYDTILTNPPFFQNDLLSPDEGVNRAHHAQSLSFGELLLAIGRLLKPEGTWHVLLPVAESNELTLRALEQGWYAHRTLSLRHSPAHLPFRIMTTFTGAVNGELLVQNEELSIYESDARTYTVAFRKLLQEFYLIF